MDAPDTVEFHDTEYHFLGKDAEQGFLHYYRHSPEYAKFLLLSEDQEGQLQEDDRMRALHGDPEARVQEYQYQHPWETTVEEIVGHDYRSLPDPEFNPELNEALGGSILLNDGRYVLPFRAPFSTAADILEQETKDTNDIYVDYRPQYLELTPENALEKYQLSPVLRGSNEITGTQILDEITVLDRGSEEVYNTFQVDELAEDYFVDQLSDVDGIDSSLAELLVDEYTNLRTVSWATTSDVEHMENTWDLDCHELFKELGDAEGYRNEQSPDAGVLQLPERVKEKHGLEEDDEETEEENDSEQVGLTDF